VLTNLSQSATKATRHADRYNLVAALLGMVLLVLVVTLLVRWIVARRVLVVLAVVGFATASLGLLALPTRF
jgi:mannose/fructose/N-acetylgalactosamine-specific phosphotransferase system component IID